MVFFFFFIRPLRHTSASWLAGRLAGSLSVQSIRVIIIIIIAMSTNVCRTYGKCNVLKLFVCTQDYIGTFVVVANVILMYFSFSLSLCLAFLI